jgi:LCP family protein required for cell wall assembly
MALYQRLRRQILTRVGLVRIALVLLILLGVAGVYTGIIRPIYRTLQPIIEASQTVLPAVNGRTNFLILGIAGSSDHAGALLTDTIMLASVNPTTKDVAILSIPRDVWVPSMRAKINSAYYYGHQKQATDGGLILAKSAVGEVTNIPVHYGLVVDFSSFERIIDLLGGVDVNVERSFEDKRYPIAGRENDVCDGDPEYECRYETLNFAQGIQHMDGATALKFARSRHAEGDEGTDFARSARQEKIILALRAKVLSREILTDPKKLKQLTDMVIASIKTDIPEELYPALVKMGLGLIQVDPRTTALSSDLFINPPISRTYDNQWVLVPRTEEEVQDFVKTFLKL